MPEKCGFRKGELRRILRGKLGEVFGSDLSRDHVLAAVPNCRKRLYTTEAYRFPAAADVLYILLRYADGESVEKLAKQCKDAKLLGLSSSTIETVARRVAEWPEQLTVRTLMECLEPPDRYAKRLSRILVDRLDETAGEASKLPEALQWRHWHLVEITFFVRTGLWPPRIIEQLIPDEFYEWVSMTLQTALPAARVLSGESPGRNMDEIQKDWDTLQRLAEEAGLHYRHDVIAANISREAVRVALMRGARPHWTEARRGVVRDIPPCWREIPKRGRPRKR